MKRKKLAIAIVLIMSAISLWGCSKNNPPAKDANKISQEQTVENSESETTESLPYSDSVINGTEKEMKEPSESNRAESAGLNNTSAVVDNTNTFVGTINGEDVIGYLDSTYTYHLSGEMDYNATFITLDENNAPEYEIYIRINKDTPTGIYNHQSDKDKAYLTVYTVFDKTSQKFGGSYTFRDSNKSWTMELTNAEYSDDGVFQGTVEGTCMPGHYNSSPAYKELPISGSFYFQMRTIHPTMETYRAGNPKYDAAHKVSYIQSFGTPYVDSFSGGDDSPGSKSSVDHTCRTCHGTGTCQKCYGERAIINSYNHKVEKCVRCQGSGKCAVCYGKGIVN